MQEYDLALEEKLLAEIEADKKAQEAAKLRAKAGKGKVTPKAKAKVTGMNPFFSPPFATHTHRLVRFLFA